MFKYKILHSNKMRNKSHIKVSRLCVEKQEGVYSLSIDHMGGYLFIEYFKKSIDLLELILNIDIRVVKAEGIYFRNLNGNEIEKVLESTENMTSKTIIKQKYLCIKSYIYQRNKEIAITY